MIIDSRFAIFLKEHNNSLYVKLMIDFLRKQNG